MLSNEASKPVVRAGGRVYLDGVQIGEVEDHGWRFLSTKTGSVWRWRRLPWHKWQGFNETRREAVADLVQYIETLKGN